MGIELQASAALIAATCGSATTAAPGVRKFVTGITAGSFALAETVTDWSASTQLHPSDASARGDEVFGVSDG